MQQELGDHEKQPCSLSPLPERPISPSQQGLAEGEEAVMAEADGFCSETIAAAAAAAAAAAFAPGFHTDGQDHVSTAGSECTDALDLLASISDER